MDPLLIIAIIVILVALIGFSGIWSAIKSAAWVLLVIGIVVLVLSFLF